MWANAIPSLSCSMTFVMSFGAFLQLFMSPNVEDSVDVNAFMPWVCWFSRSSINFPIQYLSAPSMKHIAR